MMSRLISFFTESGKVLISPDELFYLKSQSRDYNGILSAIFYSAFLGLIIGLLTGEPLVIVFLIIGAIIVTLLFKVIQAIFIYIFSRILGGKGSYRSTLNLISYSSVFDVFLILGLALTSINNMVIMPLILLVIPWRMVINITAVNTEFEIGFGKSFLATYGILLLILTVIVGLL
ncbi:YIP1 family protein [Methanosphaera sp.]|jgi:hypothetical protein|uniref:YIP1 family protein n=1 Tax=Methanosphaera sp. TaxID=2666342 RepID=UPI003D8C8B2F